MASMASGQRATKPESSVLSRTQSVSNAADVANRNAIISGSSSRLDNLFPLFDEMLKSTRISPFLYQLLIMFNTLQIICTSFWPAFEDIHQYNGICGKIVKILCQIAYFSDLSDSDTMHLVGFIVLTILCVVITVTLMAQAFIYKNRRRFIKWTLYPTRFVLEFVPLILICPIGYFVGTLFKRVIKEQSALTIVYFVLGTIYSAFIFFMQYIVSFLNANSPYISSAPTASWSGSFYFIFTANFGIWPILGQLLSIFQQYYSMILIGTKLSLSAYLIWILFTLPLIHVQINAVVFSIIVSYSSLDVITLLRLFGVKIDYMIYLIVVACFFVIIGFAGTKIFEKIVKIYTKRLSKSALELFGDDEYEINESNLITPNSKAPPMMMQDLRKRQLFTKYGISRSPLLAELYLRVGLLGHCDLFIDWSLIKFVGECHNNPHMYCVITQFLSCFPSESRLLNFFFVQTVFKPNLSFSQRFLLYETHRVKGLRQSSASSEITDKLMDLKRLTQTCITAVQDFWRYIPNEPSIFFDIKTMTNQTQALFNEAMDMWPNNVRLCEDFSTFLIECATDFTMGIKIKHRADLIEQGKNFIVDISFRSLVRAFPMYLKRNIVDVRGNFVHLKNTPGSRSASSNNPNSQMSTGTIDGELDMEIEEQLAKANFGYHRVRLAYQRSLLGRRSDHSNRLKGAAFWALLLSISMLIFCFIFLYDEFKPRADNLKRQYELNKVRYGYDATLASLSFHWIHFKNGITDDSLKHYDRSDGTSVYGINLTNGLDESNKWTFFATIALNHFMEDVVSMASSGINVYSVISPMINDDLTVLTCYGPAIIPKTTSASLKNELSYLFQNMRHLIQSDDVVTWAVSSDMCEIINNIPYMVGLFDKLQASMANDQIAQREETQNLNKLIVIPTATIFFIITEPFLLFFLYKTLKELKYMLQLMQSVDDQSKIEAAKYLKNEFQNEDQADRLSDTNHKRGVPNTMFYISVFIPIVIQVVIFVGIFLLAQNKNSSFLILSSWMTLGVSRANLMLEAVTFAALAISVPKYIQTNITGRRMLKQLGAGLMMSLNFYNNFLLRGTGKLTPCVGINKRLDELNFVDRCEPTRDSSDLHDLYKCFAIDRGISFLQEIGSKIFDDLESQTFENGSLFYHMFHLFNYHLADNSYEAAYILSDLAQISITEFHNQLIGLCFGGIAINILGFAIFWSLLLKLDIAYDGALQLLRRLSPPSVVSNVSLLNYLLNRSNEKVSNKMTTSKSVIYMSKDAVLCLNRNESIEVVNSAISSLFGYTPEQLLGQPISTILPTQGAEEIFNRFNLMRLGQCSMSYETRNKGITDDEQSVPVHVTILGIVDSNSTQAKSFAVIFRDETQLQKQRKAAEEAKQQSERLLYQILPRDIVTRLNAGETDISFVVPSATIIFIDIVKFSDYASTLTPPQIMENLSKIFARFDLNAAKFPLITKIKLIGDVYMAAAGLFTPAETVSNHASQVVQFGLDILAALDEINANLDSSLQVRIGVNTDGPLIAGVLGTDKPLFDIIGDPINVASRLQSTCIPGTVQISQTTYDAIRDLNFNIEQRGEISLKGKGMKMAFIVRGFPSGSFFVCQENTGEEQFT